MADGGFVLMMLRNAVPDAALSLPGSRHISIGLLVIYMAIGSFAFAQPTFTNPIIPGRFADPSVIKVKDDYYMTHSMGGTPSLLIWHSRDLVHWKPIAHAANDYYGSPWAPDLVFHKGKYYLYTTWVGNAFGGKRSFENAVMVADRPEGPWSKPKLLGVQGLIDPGHVVDEQGNRWLYFNKGQAIQLDESGTKTIGEIMQVYDGWPYPDDWVVECFCLESPKLFYRKGYYYLISAQGGTAGPATSHMAVVARSKCVLGPWENAPDNPLIHTQSKNERWWSQGHATLIDAGADNWVAIYHAYENGYRPLGRQTLMLPVEWTTDGWPKVAEGMSAEKLLPASLPLSSSVFTTDWQDDFTSAKPHWRWRTLNPFRLDSLLQFGGGKIVAAAKGSSAAEGNLLATFPFDHHFEVSVQLTVEKGAHSGLFFYTDNNPVGYALQDGQLQYLSGSNARSTITWQDNTVWLKMRYDNNDLIYYYSANGRQWTKLPNSADAAPMRNALILLSAYGTGSAVYRHFIYKKLP